MLKLYDYYRSSACFRVRIALYLKDLPFEQIPIHLINQGGEQHSQHYREINPQQLVPSLQDGEHVLTQSLAIIEYLEEKFPQPALLPKNSFEKACVRAFALAIIADTHPLNNLRVLTYLVNELSFSEDEKIKWYQHWVGKTFTALETQLAKGPQSPFCFGETPTLADLCLVPQMYNARRYHCDLSSYPRLVAIDAHCQSQSKFQKAFPKETEVA